MFTRELFHYLTDGVVIMDRDRIIQQMNPAARKLTGWQIGEKVPYCTFCQKRELMPGEERCLLAEKEPVPYFESEMPVYGENLPVAFSTTYLPGKNDMEKQMVLMIRDISKKKKEEEARMAKLITRQTIEAQEAEKKRMAQELHDGVGQSLYSVSMGLHRLVRQIDEEEAKNTVAELQTILNDTMSEVKRLSANLRPDTLDMLGLGAAISSLIHSMERHFPIKITLKSVLRTEHRMAPHIELNIYRIIQEILNNIVKHSNSPTAYVSVDFANRHDLVISIRDEGIGFNVNEVHSGLGLKHVKERTVFLDGHLEINSAPGEGSSFHLYIPGAWKGEKK
ncbi:PAS domain-containing sensor histidine kinase [Aneurinibacillus terranovensis]|uniref:PAS domain-containing sensor histidine kinase n=1 Tax=Aneurinibacillus terranovensis TaxID=278991 RepID=UPI0004180633|nr:PAS domain-containing sensor histidine kinase [Aneurinibacillus terranovensis]